MIRKPAPTAAFATSLLLVLGLALLFGSGCSNQNGQKALGTVAGPKASSSAAGSLLAADPREVNAVIRTQNDHSRELLAISGVVGTATGRLADGGIGILILTRREVLTGIPRSLDGVRLEQRVVGDVVAFAVPAGDSTIQCGTSTGNDNQCSAGTISCVLMQGSNKVFLSNNHVFARENQAAIGERLDAPGRYDAMPKCAHTPQCGTLSDFEPLQFGSGTNVIDAAIAVPPAGLSFTCAEAGGYTPTSNVAAASVGMPVKKTGRTTGLTHGTVSGVNVTIQVGYRAGTATFVDQIMVAGIRGPFLRSGDSGSLLVGETSNDPVGLCFAGSPLVALANPIAPVLSRFSATVCGQ